MSYSNYLSIEDILVTNERVPCKILYDLPRMGFLDPSTAEDDLKSTSKVELPLWLAEALYHKRSPFVSIELPKIYKESYREILNADACTVDMNKLGQYFYEVGCYIAKHDIKGEVSTTLTDAFRQRFRMLLTASVSADYVNSMEPLSVSERRSAVAAADADRNLTDWLQKGKCLMKTATIVANHKKRKRAEMEFS